MSSSVSLSLITLITVLFGFLFCFASGRHLTMNKVISGDGTSLLFISDASICTNDIRRRISLLLIGAFNSDNTNDQSAAYVA